MSSELGLANQDRINAALMMNEKVPAGQILVVPATAPSSAAGVSTTWTAAAGTVAGLIVWLANQVIDLTTEQNASAVVLLTAGLNYLFSWLRHSRENANAPGVGIAPS